MILISNHLLSLPGFKVPDGAVVRINMAWVPDADTLKRYLDIPHTVFLDYPMGRKKPPTPTLTMYQAVKAAEAPNVAYLAVSNVETARDASIQQQWLGDRAQFVPKIETQLGVDNLDAILGSVQPPYVMLDTEDLFADVQDSERFYTAVRAVEFLCANHSVDLLRMYGVVFSEI